MKFFPQWLVLSIAHRLLEVLLCFAAFLAGMGSFNGPYHPLSALLYNFLDFPVVLLMIWQWKSPSGMPDSYNGWWNFPHHLPLDPVAMLWSCLIGLLLVLVLNLLNHGVRRRV